MFAKDDVAAGVGIEYSDYSSGAKQEVGQYHTRASAPGRSIAISDLLTVLSSPARLTTTNSLTHNPPNNTSPPFP
jgi:hypothetical protein